MIPLYADQGRWPLTWLNEWCGEGYLYHLDHGTVCRDPLPERLEDLAKKMAPG